MHLPRIVFLLTTFAALMANSNAQDVVPENGSSTPIDGSTVLEDGFVLLFDGKTLDGWKSARSKGEGDYGPFQVVPEEQVIHVYRGLEANSEQTTDCLYTEKEYSRYILRLEYKWLEKRFQPRADYDRDAGLLYHVHGDPTKVWPFSLEMQIGETNIEEFDKKNRKKRYHTGDLFVLGGHLRCGTMRTDGTFDPKGELVTAKGGCPTSLGREKPKGQWNEMEIEVDGSNGAIYRFNGELVHHIKNLEQKVDGEYVPLEKGRIGLQAEWAELLYRNIRIKELPIP